MKIAGKFEDDKNIFEVIFAYAIELIFLLSRAFKVNFIDEKILLSPFRGFLKAGHDLDF